MKQPVSQRLASSMTATGTMAHPRGFGIGRPHDQNGSKAAPQNNERQALPKGMRSAPVPNHDYQDEQDLKTDAYPQTASQQPTAQACRSKARDQSILRGPTSRIEILTSKQWACNQGSKSRAQGGGLRKASKTPRTWRKAKYEPLCCFQKRNTANRRHDMAARVTNRKRNSVRPVIRPPEPANDGDTPESNTARALRQKLLRRSMLPTTLNTIQTHYDVDRRPCPT